MRKSKAIALSLLGLGFAGLSAGCGSSKSTESDATEPITDESESSEVLFEPDDTWHDENGNEIARSWTTDANGNQVPGTTPYDRIGRPWVYGPTGILVPPLPIIVRVISVNGSTVFVQRVGGVGSGRVMAITRSGFGATGHGIGVAG